MNHADASNNSLFFKNGINSPHEKCLSISTQGKKKTLLFSMNITNTSQAPGGFDNMTSAVCAPSSMHPIGIVMTTFISLILYGVAFFIMSTAVGSDPRMTTIASFRSNCLHYCQFMKNTFGGIFFCCNKNSNGAPSNEFVDLPTRRRSAINGGDSSRVPARNSNNGGNRNSSNSRRGFQLLTSAPSGEDTSAGDAYADNNEPAATE